MSEKNFLICRESAAVAVSQTDVEKVVTIQDEQVLEDLHKLIKQRRDLGVRLSRKLKDQGLDSADDNAPTVVECAFPDDGEADFRSS